MPSKWTAPRRMSLCCIDELHRAPRDYMFPPNVFSLCEWLSAILIMTCFKVAPTQFSPITINDIFPNIY